MRNIKLTIEYDGTDFKGWQIQKKGERTVQGEIKKALKKILNEDVTLIGSGRTDSGVHALGQVANFHTHSTKTLKQIKDALNYNCADDIAISKVVHVKRDFHAQFNAKEKTYRYLILNQKERKPLIHGTYLQYPYPLDLALIKKESKSLVGTHDFLSFKAANPANRGKKENTVRTIKQLKIAKRSGLIQITITADGFLYKMVRNIIGTLLEVGNGKRPTGSIKSLLKKKDRQLAGKTAKPQGLTLMSVKY